MRQKLSVTLIFLAGVCFATFVSLLPYLLDSNRIRKSQYVSGNPLLSTTANVVARLGIFQWRPVYDNWDNFFPSDSPGIHETALIRNTGHFVPKLNSANADLKAEAVASFNLALEMKESGKIAKAKKLFNHALNLDPLHADILYEYGWFLEEHQNDVLLAEHMYNRALTVSPDHQLARQKRKNVLPLVEELDQKSFGRIDRKRDLLMKIPDSNLAFRRAKKEAYFQHIYHTTALEGNTMNLMQTRYIVETRMAIAGKSILEHNEILGMDAALSFINNTLLNRIGRISMADILDIHVRVLGAVEPTEAGKLRATQVYVGGFAPPEPIQLVPLMSEFLEWLNSAEAMSLHPIEFAARAHYRLVYIHPFVDGNGRTSRLLMNLVLMQAGYPPVVVRVEDRLEYYETLEKANHGDLRPFVRFIARCTEQTVDTFLRAITEHNVSALEIASVDDGRTIIMEGGEVDRED
ncbi:PREDICTED: adenosine monophosphate-protein transferase FICD-like [Priapulus caudatus]|uniref:protein adenylyltransferase n=1 Tax=Priapulus caudatus TaxID=37621 RepID=A0ABM1ETX0_PRICU|nr:PREDICTED: adenosine monophosphate-protein transferase FICD-like [Priapulus caudatus]